MIQWSEAALLDAGVGQGRDLRSDGGLLSLLAAKGRGALVELAQNGAHKRML